MKVGVNLSFANYNDWDRYLAKKPGPPETTDQEIYAEDIHLASLVEPLGFDSYWAIDHHFSPYVMTAGALQHLTYFAGKTSRIDFGTMIVVFPWYDPLIIADQVSVLDNLLAGRQLTLGVGRGAAIREFDPFRIPMGEARGRFNETLDILRLAMTQEFFSYDGQFFKIPETSIRPHYRNPERILARMKAAWTSTDSMMAAAHGDLGILMTNQKSWEDYKVDVTAFNKIRAGNGKAPTQPIVNVRAVCLDTTEEAWDVMARHALQVAKATKLQYQLDDAERFANTPGYEQYAKINTKPVSDEETIEKSGRPQVWGDPDKVFERIKFIQEMTSAEEIILNFRFGTMPVETAERSLRLFAEEVLPRVHALETPLHVGMDGTGQAEHNSDAIDLRL
jgi:alkanesulfonate monooxygenase SsuD/methylene tetrahydromethanopterin reductase-like flavin-dependent oxidoreductase (luciferase family)